MSDQVGSTINRIKIIRQSRQNHVQPSQPNHKKFNEILQQSQPFSQQNMYFFNQNIKPPSGQLKQKPRKRSQNINSIAQQLINHQHIDRARFQTISLPQLSKKMQKMSLSIFKTLYNESFLDNKDYSIKINKIKVQQNVDKMICFYTNVVYEIVKKQEMKIFMNDSIEGQQRQRRNAQLIVHINKKQRRKLKLVVSQDQKQPHHQKGNNKNFQTYIRKIQQQSQRHKRQHIQIKQKNRHLQNQMLKISLQFKNKRQLYLNQITRLTQILYSSFMEVGKMLSNQVEAPGMTNLSNLIIGGGNRNDYRNNHYNGNNMYGSNQQSNFQIHQQGKNSYIKALGGGLNRKNIKSEDKFNYNVYYRNQGGQLYGLNDVKRSVSPKNSLKPQVMKRSIQKNIAEEFTQPQLRKIGSQSNPKLYQSSTDNLGKNNRKPNLLSTVLTKKQNNADFL